ncbi:MAG: 4a-hydroxytetrahydrobiopterin dehydratase [Chlamydiota bacterium]|nr:4a-hydroxytetrahydrobiopterin dehydratase [Chlamydiota bacterium]
MNLSEMKCKSCEGGLPAFKKEKAQQYCLQLSGWQLVEDSELKIQKIFQFRDFIAAMKFVNQVADMAEEQNHHPDIAIHYNKVDILIWTHAVKGLTENDFILAAKIDCI